MMIGYAEMVIARLCYSFSSLNLGVFLGLKKKKIELHREENRLYRLITRFNNRRYSRQRRGNLVYLSLENNKNYLLSLDFR